MILPAVVAALAAAVVATGLVPLLERWSRRSGLLLDVPNERSSHRVPTPRVGGVAIALGVLAGLGLAWIAGAPPVPGALVAGAVAITAMSFADDLRPLPALLRLGAHAIVAAAVVAAVPPRPAGPVSEGLAGAAMVLVALWVVGLVNAYNFMDGIDGIAGAQAVTAAAGWALVGVLTGAPGVTALAVALGVASAAFLRSNWPPARVFMGDSGSAFLGYAFAVIPLAAGSSAGALAAAGLFVWPFVFDAAFTFLRRLARGENVMRAHRGHLYQRLVASGLSHRQVSLAYLGLALVGLPAGVCAATGRPGLAALLGAALAAPAVVLWRAVGRRERAVAALARG